MGKKDHIQVTSYNQQGGITAYQVVLERGDRILTDPVANQLESVLSQESFNTIDLVAVWGDQEAFRFASQINNYLTDQGYNVKGVSQAAFSQPVQGQIVEKPDSSGVLKIIIGGR